MADFAIPDWMPPYIPEMVDLGGSKPEDLVRAMNEYGGKAGTLLATPEGKAISANAQVSLLMRLHVAGMLKEK